MTAHRSDLRARYATLRLVANVNNAFSLLVLASRAALMSHGAHGDCTQAARVVGEALKEAEGDTAKKAELAEELRVSLEERGYFEQLTECLINLCLENQVDTLKALGIETPDSIDRLAVVKQLAPESS